MCGLSHTYEEWISGGGHMLEGVDSSCDEILGGQIGIVASLKKFHTSSTTTS